MKQKKYYIETKERKCIGFDTLLTKLEMRAFGWRDKGFDSEFDGYDIDLEIDWDNDKVSGSANSRFIVYNVFKRVKPYSRSFLFKLMEVFMNIFSWIRRMLIGLLMGMVIILFGIGAISLLLGSASYGSEGFYYGAIILLIIYMPSIVITILGFLFRVVTRQESKLKKQLKQNGYDEDQKF